MQKIEKYNHVLTGITASILGNLFMFATTVFLTRTFEPDVYGEFRLLFSFGSFLVIVFLFGRDSGIIYFTQKNKLEENKIIVEEVFFGCITLCLGTLVFYLLSAYVVEDVFNNEVSMSHYHLSLLMIPLWGVFNLLTAAIKVKGFINYSFILSNFSQRVIRIPFMVACALISLSFISLALGMILSQILLIYMAIRKVSDSLSYRAINIKNFPLRFTYAFQICINVIVIVAMTKVDLIMVGIMIDNTNVAIYDTVALLALVVILPFEALVKSTEPSMQSLLVSQDVKDKYFQNLKLAFELSLGILLFFLITGESALAVFGEVYAKGYGSLCVLSIGFVILVFLGPQIELLNMNGKGKVSFIILVCSLILNFIFNILFIPSFGILGAALATMISLILCKLCAMYFVIKNFKINLINSRLVIWHILLFLIMYLIAYKINWNSPISQPIKGVLISAVYCLIIVLSDQKYRKYLSKTQRDK